MNRKTKRALRRLILITCAVLTGCVVVGVATETTVFEPNAELLRGADGHTLIMRITNRRVSVFDVLKEREYRAAYAERLETMQQAFPYDRIQVEIDSAGGVVRAARGIGKALAERGEYKHIVIDGACGSSMIQILALSRPDYVSMTERSAIILHQKKNALTWADTGNNADEIAGIMALTGQDETTVRLWFAGLGENRQTHFNRAQASACGFLGAKEWKEDGT